MTLRRPDAGGRGAPAGSARREMLRRILLHASVVAGAVWPGAAPALSGHGLGRAAARWQPVEIVAGNALFVDVDVDGHAMSGILDTGSGATIIDAAAAARLGLTGDVRGIHGLATRVEVTVAGGVTVKAGGATRSLPRVLVGDLAAMSAAVGRRIDLLLGADLYADHCLAIDFGRRRFAIAPSGTFRAGRDWTSIPLSRGDREELLISASLGARPPAPMMVDTGNAVPLLLSGVYGARVGLPGNARSSSALMAGVDGVRTVDLFLLDELRIAGASVVGVPTVGMPSWTPVSAVGSVGLPVLGQFDLVLDLPRHTLWLRRLPAKRRLPLLKDRSGLGVRLTPTGLIVMHVATNSPAARDGWTPGLRIVAIDAAAIDETYTAGTLWRWRYRPAGETVKLGLASGEQRMLRLADYF